MHLRTWIGIGLFASLAFGDIEIRPRPLMRNDLPPGRGFCEIRLQVDDTVDVVLDGDRIFVKNITGQDARDEGSACNMPLPRREVDGFNFAIREARTRDIQLVEQPGRQNGGRVVVRIHDGPGGFGRYIFEVSWNAGRPGGDDRDRGDRRDYGRDRDLRIIRAVWGIEGRDREVTEVLRDHIREGHLRIRATNEEIGFDPAYGSVKSLFVIYELNGRRQEVRIPEGQVLDIP
jgi:hypothetical protein